VRIKLAKWLGLFGAAVALGGLVPSIRASEVTFTASGSATGGDGPIAAQAVFTTSSGELQVTITNTLSPATIGDAGQSVSDLSFTISNAPGTDGTNTAAGQLVDVAKGGAVTDESGTPDRWISSTNGGFSISGDTITLEAIGGSQPTQLILPSDGGGGYPDADGSIYNTHNPYTDGPATFTLDLSGVTSSTTITAATFSFGTSPDTFLPGVTPEPASMLLFGTGLLGIGFLMRKNLSRTD
jgi:PEP-CTERM motif